MNVIHVIHVENRLVLANGSHRAYALHDLGITKVPCLVQQVIERPSPEGEGFWVD
jgi:ParB-like chromosome segregation protein Spo0J